MPTGNFNSDDHERTCTDARIDKNVEEGTEMRHSPSPAEWVQRSWKELPEEERAIYYARLHEEREAKSQRARLRRCRVVRSLLDARCSQHDLT